MSPRRWVCPSVRRTPRMTERLAIGRWIRGPLPGMNVPATGATATAASTCSDRRVDLQRPPHHPRRRSPVRIRIALLSRAISRLGIPELPRSDGDHRRGSGSDSGRYDPGFPTLDRSTGTSRGRAAGEDQVEIHGGSLTRAAVKAHKLKALIRGSQGQLSTAARGTMLTSAPVSSSIGTFVTASPRSEPRRVTLAPAPAARSAPSHTSASESSPGSSVTSMENSSICRGSARRGLQIREARGASATTT